MNRPPLPATPSAKRTRRPGQNLACLAPGHREAVLLSVIPKIPQSQWWILVKRTDVPVKVVRISSCTAFFSKSFTLLIGETEENKSPKRAGATPLFRLSAAQRVFGSLPPVFFQSRMCEEPDGASGERVIACAVHLMVHRYVHSPTGVSLSVLTVSLDPMSALRTSPKHRVGLERPHFVATETAAVAPAQSKFINTGRISEPCTDVPSQV